MIVHLHKENGHVTDQRTLDSVCGFLPNGDYVATIEPKAQWEKRQPRTISQNALFWLWCADIANFFNKTYGDDHCIDKWVETSKLNKRQMTDFMNKIQSYMATEHGATVPLPDDEKYNDFKNIYS